MKVLSFSVWSNGRPAGQSFEAGLSDLERWYAENFCWVDGGDQEINSDARSDFVAERRTNPAAIAAVIEWAFGEPVPCVDRIATVVVEVREHADVARRLGREVGLWDDLERLVNFAPVYGLIEGLARYEQAWLRQRRGHPKTDADDTNEITNRAHELFIQARRDGKPLSVRRAACLASDELASKLSLSGSEKTKSMNRARKAVARRLRNP